MKGNYMNRTNTGANTDTEQILVDIFVMAIAFGIDLLLFKNMIGAGELPGLIISCDYFYHNQYSCK